MEVPWTTDYYKQVLPVASATPLVSQPYPDQAARALLSPQHFCNQSTKIDQLVLTLSKVLRNLCYKIHVTT